jgi:hypothetical protein
MKLIPFQNNQLICRNNNLVTRLFSPKLTGEDVLKEMINISNQLKINLKQNVTQLTNFYSGQDFQQLLHKKVQSDSFLHEQSKERIYQTLVGFTSPGVLVTKPSISIMDKYLTFEDFETYNKLPHTTQFTQSLATIDCNLEQSSHIYNPNSKFHNLKSILQGKQNLNRVFNEVVEILQPNSIVNSVSTGHGLNEELFDLNGNIFSITLDENNIYPEKRKEIGKYYWPQFELLFSWTVNKYIPNQLAPLTAHTFLEDSQFIKDIFYQNKLK